MLCAFLCRSSQILKLIALKLGLLYIPVFRDSSFSMKELIVPKNAFGTPVCPGFLFLVTVN